MIKIEKLMLEDGWKLVSYKNCGVEYFAFNKSGMVIRCEDISEIDDLDEWKKVTVEVQG